MRESEREREYTVKEERAERRERGVEKEVERRMAGAVSENMQRKAGVWPEEGSQVSDHTHESKPAARHAVKISRVLSQLG